MKRLTNQKRNRLTYARTARQNQDPDNALTPWEKQIIAEQKAARGIAEAQLQTGTPDRVDEITI